MEWAFKGLNGYSGGLLIMWKKGLFDLYVSYHGEGFVGIIVGRKGGNFFVVNVYSSCVSLLKIKL